MSSGTRSTLEQATSIGGICVIIGAVSDLAAPIGNYKLYALCAGVAVLLVGLVLLKLKTLSNPYTQSALTFGVLLSAISGYLLMANPDLNVSTIAGVSDQVKTLQGHVLGLEQTAKSIKEDTEKTAAKAEEIAKLTKQTLNLSVTSEQFFGLVSAKNFAGLDAACQSGVRARGTNLAIASKGRYDTNLYRDDEVFDFLVDKQCFEAKVFCNEPFDDDLVEHATPARIERLCGAGVKKRYADLRTKMLSERAAQERKWAEEAARKKKEDERKIARCTQKVGDSNWCQFAGPAMDF